MCEPSAQPSDSELISVPFVNMHLESALEPDREELYSFFPGPGAGPLPDQSSLDSLVGVPQKFPEVKQGRIAVTGCAVSARCR